MGNWTVADGLGNESAVSVIGSTRTTIAVAEVQWYNGR